MILQWQYLLGCLLASGVGIAFGYWLALLIVMEPLQYELRETKAEVKRLKHRVERLRGSSPTFKRVPPAWRGES